MFYKSAIAAKNVFIQRDQAVPRYIIIFISICLIGLVFPIYGLHIAGFKLTIFRLGLFLLFLSVVSFHKIVIKSADSKIILLLFGLLALIRILSLLLTRNMQPGFQQIEWYLEGIVFLLLNVTLSSHFIDYSNIYLRLLFYIGLISISVMAVQFILIYLNKTWTLPFSTSAFGFEANEMRPWTYPLYGGRIIGAFYEPNMAGSLCVFYLSAYFPLLFQKSKLIYKKWKIIIAFIIATLAMISTGSIQSALAFIVVFIITLFMTEKKRYFIPLVTLFIILAVLSQIISSKYSLNNIFAETSIQRFLFAKESGDLSGGRMEYIASSLANIKIENIIFGIGEGMAEHTAHNAFLIVLIENGFVAFIILIIISILLVLGPLLKHRNYYQLDNLKISSVCISSTWIILILINWAQININISYMFLVIPIIYLNIGKSVRRKGLKSHLHF